MKTYYIKAIIFPNGIDRIMECGLMLDAGELTDAFSSFQDHYEEQWGVGITYTVTQVVEVQIS
jgi:hypothetical protein